MNKKEKNLLLILGIFFIGSLLFFLFYDSTPEQVVKTEVVATTTVKSTLSTAVESLTKKTKKIEILVEYPQITDAKPESIESSINAQFKKSAQATYEQTFAELEDAAGGPGVSEVVYKRTLIKDKTYSNTETGILSVAYKQYSDTGGAHGTFYYGGEIVNTKNGIKVTLKNLLQGEYESAILKELERQITGAASTCLRCDSISAELDNLKVFIPDTYVLSDQGITFLFSAYDLGSYVATVSGQEVFIDKVFLDQYILRNW